MKVFNAVNLSIFILGMAPSVLLPVPVQAGVKELWYMYRGRENMKIKNYKAAIEAYEKAVQIDANNREAARDLGLAYENQGLVDKAVNQYDSYLGQWSDDHEIALRQARLLKWSRYSYRQKDAIKYYKMSLKQNNNSQVRLEYAEVLAAKKETSEQSIPEYEAVLRVNPRSAEAHRGLAKVYAWSGDQDQSLYHARLAREYGDQSSDTKRLESNLEKDRRPKVGVEGLMLHQVSSREFDLSGVRAGAYGQYHLNPFLSAQLRGGGESFWNENDNKSSGYLGLGLEYRMNPEKTCSLELTYHGISADGFEGDIGYESSFSDSRLKFGVRHELKYDSYLALVGKKDSAGRSLGTARSTFIYSEFNKKLETMDLTLKPMLGWITAHSVTPNLFYGFNLNATKAFTEPKWAIVSYTVVASYQKDHSGFSDQNFKPFAGGYFSPSFLLSQDLLLRYQVGVTEEDYWSMGLGPSYQYVNGTTSDGSKFGARLDGEYFQKINNNLFVHILGGVQKVADVYTQLKLMGWLSYGF